MGEESADEIAVNESSAIEAEGYGQLTRCHSTTLKTLVYESPIY